MNLAPAPGSTGAISGFAGAMLPPDVLDPYKRQEGNFGVIPAAAGLTGTVTKPTMILAGERGPENIKIDPLDQPYIERVRRFREGAQYPGGNIYDVGFFQQDPYIRNSYLMGLQGRYGIPAESVLAQAQRYQLQGLQGRTGRIGY